MTSTIANSPVVSVPVLSKTTRVDLGGLLHDLPAPREQSPPCQAADRRHHRCGRGQDQGARASHDEDRYRSPDPLGCLDAAGQEVHGSRCQENRRQEVPRVAVRDPHDRRRPMIASLFDQVDQAGQRRLVTGVSDPHVQQTVTVHGSGEDLVP